MKPLQQRVAEMLDQATEVALAADAQKARQRRTALADPNCPICKGTGIIGGGPTTPNVACGCQRQMKAKKLKELGKTLNVTTPLSTFIDLHGQNDTTEIFDLIKAELAFLRGIAAETAELIDDPCALLLSSSLTCAVGTYRNYLLLHQVKS